MSKTISASSTVPRPSAFPTALAHGPQLRAGQRGFTLVEILVGLAVSLFLLTGILNIYLASSRTYRVTEGVGRLQENARFAMETLARDLRAAGKFGCDTGRESVAVAATVTGSRPAEFISAQAVTGFGDGVAFPASIPGPQPGTDAFIVQFAEPQETSVVTGHNAMTATITLANNHSFDPNEILVMSSATCANAGVFSKTGGGAATLVHAGAGNNCTSALIGDWTCATGGAGTPPSLDMAYPPNSTVSPLAARAYFIGQTGAGDIGLRVRWLGNGGTLANTQQLIDGVEDMQVLYGVDTNGDFIADAYRQAGAVGNWANVVSARVSLLLQTADASLDSGQGANLTEGAAQTIFFDKDGDGIAEQLPPFADGRLRLAQTFTVSLRNRLP